MIEDQPNRLAPRRCCTPTPRIFRDEGRLDRAIFVFRGDLDHGCTLDVYPAFDASPNTLRGCGDKALSHTLQFTTIQEALLCPDFPRVAKSCRSVAIFGHG